MNIFELMDYKVSSFSKTDRRIYELIKKFPEQFAYLSISEISANGDISKPALSRFAQKLGFSGYLEFQYQFSQELKERTEHPQMTSNAEVYGKLLKEVEQTVTNEDLEAVAEHIRNSRQVCIFGSNMSRLPAELLNISLRFESDVLCNLVQTDVPPANHNHRDVYIVFSAITGNSYQDLMRDLRTAGENKPYLILITVNSKHPLRHNFDKTIVLPTVSLADGNHIVFSDTFAFMMFIDMFTIYLKNTRKD